MSAIHRSFWAGALLLVVGPNRVPAQPPAGRSAVQSIRALREQSNAAIARHDTAGIAATLAPRVVVFTSTSAMTIGRDENARMFAGQFAVRPDVGYRRTPSDVRVFEAWRMASEQGRWVGRWTDADGPVRIEGIYFAKWRQLDGQWLIESETYVPERCTGGRYCRTSPQ